LEGWGYTGPGTPPIVDDWHLLDPKWQRALDEMLEPGWQCTSPLPGTPQSERQRTASVAKRIPTALLTNILEMKHEMEVVEWREEHKQQFAPVLDVIECVVPVRTTTGGGVFLGWFIPRSGQVPSSWSSIAVRAVR
jgi:hypothetical protein